MKNLTKKIAIVVVFSGIATFWGCGENTQNANTDTVTASNPTASSTLLPQDVKIECPLTLDSFSTWFAGGKVSLNGLVLPANSVDFSSHQTNCSFYNWSMQMFLWMTSPVDGYGTVMQSPVFYTVTPPDANGNRQFVPHHKGDILSAMASITQNGPDNLPEVISTDGRRFEVQGLDGNGEPTAKINTRFGKKQIHHIKIDANNKVTLFESSNKPIKNSDVVEPANTILPLLHAVADENGALVFYDKDGNRVNVESGQAGGSNALMAQNDSLVYYILFANDVFAYFNYGANTGQLTNTNTFPTTAGARDSIYNLALANGDTLKDANALAMEFKTSWVSAENLPDSNNYIRITAYIPTYTKTDTSWVQSGQRPARLALLGVHIVGSTANHPEMLWATFEHKNMTPNAAYSYINKDGKEVKVNQDGGSNWLLSSNGSDPAPNTSHMTASGNSINSKNGFTITPSNTLRLYPWGSSDLTPNPLVKSAAESNSQVISTNLQVQNWLDPNDIRRNYLLIGCLWNEGTAPNGTYYPVNTSDSASIGTSALANSTMETYTQPQVAGIESYNKARPGACFNCHVGTLLPSSPNLSHIFSELNSKVPPKKLPSAPNILKK